MLISTGRSPVGGRATRPRQAVRAKRATVAIAERKVTAQSGDRLPRINLLTGHVRPQAETTISSAAMRCRRGLGGPISSEAEGRREKEATGEIMRRATSHVKGERGGA